MHHPITALPIIVGAIYLAENLILLYFFLTPRRPPAFQAAALGITTVAAFLPYLHPGLREIAFPLMRYLLGCLFLLPCVFIFRETLQAKVFVFFMNFSLTQFIYLISTYLDRLLGSPIPQLYVVAGLLMELAALPLVARYLKAPIRSIVGIIDQQRAAFTAFPILSFALLAYYGLQEFKLTTLVTLVLSTVLIFFTYYLIAASIAVARRQQELERISNSDSLTGIFNRRHMERKIDEEFKRYYKTDQGFALIIVDIDFFKLVNDRYGHDCGDCMLKEIVADLGDAVRANDTLARWGGEEFLLLLPATKSEQAARLAERIRKRIEERRYEHEGESIAVTVTLGVSVVRPTDTILSAIKRADIALYRGKQTGRNRVVLFDDMED